MRPPIPIAVLCMSLAHLLAFCIDGSCDVQKVEDVIREATSPTADGKVSFDDFMKVLENRDEV